MGNKNNTTVDSSETLLQPQENSVIEENDNNYADINSNSETIKPVLLEHQSEDYRIPPDRLRYQSNLVDFYLKKSRIQDGENVEITYYFQEVTTSNAWFGLFPKNAALGEWGIWKYIEHTTEKKYQTMYLTLNAYGDVGAWEVRFYKDGGNENIAGRLPIFVEGEAYEGVTMSLENYQVAEGTSIQITYNIDDRIHLSSPRMYIVPKSSSIFYGLYCSLDTAARRGVATVVIPERQICGTQEIRFLPTNSTFTPRGRLQFQQTCKNPSTLIVHPKCVRDGSTIQVEYNFTQPQSHTPYLCVYPAHMQVEQYGKTYPLVKNKGKMEMKIESGQNPTGDWEVRLVHGNLTFTAAPFVVVGANEAFFTKMLLNFKHMDIDIVLQH
jgi:hypothetical protein